MASGVPRGIVTEGGMRGVKNPGTPAAAESTELVSLKTLRGSPSSAKGHPSKRLETLSQNWRKHGTRRSSGLPAMMAALMAPIDVPAIQRGTRPDSHRD
jgi:hypothetical protein